MYENFYVMVLGKLLTSAAEDTRGIKKVSD